ncbi:peptidylprolyl isomerase [Sarracenia purpurea var. burkii]
MPSDKTRASHILIKHEGSRWKASWKDPEGRVILNTTGEAAISQLKALREDIASSKASNIRRISFSAAEKDLNLGFSFIVCSNSGIPISKERGSSGAGVFSFLQNNFY